MQLVEGIATIDGVGAFVAELQALGQERGATVQAFDARYVAGLEHLERAVELANRAGERGEQIADDESVEILLYAAGRRQINRAMKMGVSEGQCPVVVVVAGGDEQAAATAIEARLDPADTLEMGDPERIREFFDISAAEVGATGASLEDLVCERVALLVVEQ